jgi:hypothetical protein
MFIKRKNMIDSVENSPSSLINLPDELTSHILSYLPPKDLLIVALVCGHFNALANENSIWQEKYLQFYPNQMKDDAENWKLRFKNDCVLPFIKKRIMAVKPKSLHFPKHLNHLYSTEQKITGIAGNQGFRLSLETRKPSFCKAPYDYKYFAQMILNDSWLLACTQSNHLPHFPVRCVTVEQKDLETGKQIRLISTNHTQDDLTVDIRGSGDIFTLVTKAISTKVMPFWDLRAQNAKPSLSLTLDSSRLQDCHLEGNQLIVMYESNSPPVFRREGSSIEIWDIRNNARIQAIDPPENVNDPKALALDSRQMYVSFRSGELANYDLDSSQWLFVRNGCSNTVFKTLKIGDSLIIGESYENLVDTNLHVIHKLSLTSLAVLRFNEFIPFDFHGNKLSFKENSSSKLRFYDF